MVLILDTARFKYPPHWVPLAQLCQAMSAVDPATGKARGFIRLAANPKLDSVMFTMKRPTRCANAKALLSSVMLLDDQPGADNAQHIKKSERFCCLASLDLLSRPPLPIGWSMQRTMLIKACVRLKRIDVSDAAGWLHNAALCKVGATHHFDCVFSAELGSKSGPSWTPRCQRFSHHISGKSALQVTHSHTLTLPLPQFLSIMRLSHQHLQGTQLSHCSGQC